MKLGGGIFGTFAAVATTFAAFVAVTNGLECRRNSDCSRFDLCRRTAHSTGLRSSERGAAAAAVCVCENQTCVRQHPTESTKTKSPRRRRNVPTNSGRIQEDIGPDTCGQDRKLLSSWFLKHGQASLLLDPIPQLTASTGPNPYDDPTKPPNDKQGGYCAMQWSADEVEGQTTNHTGQAMKKYRLADFPTPEAAMDANFTITHKGHCGACSTLQDLGVYIGQNLTSSTRRCGMEGMISDRRMTKCLQDLGFSDNCIPIWKYNIRNTRRRCFGVCIKALILNEPNNLPDGSLNSCLQCDEDESGPNFKYYSGRTRRNSGIPSAIHRPASQIYHMQHCYWYGILQQH